MHKIPIDIQEIYHAASERNCKIQIIDRTRIDGEDIIYIQIKEDNGIDYLVCLTSKRSLIGNFE